MIQVTLGPDEVTIARLIGTKQREKCIAAGSPEGHFPHGPEAVGQHINAVGSELAVGRLLDRYPYSLSSLGSKNRLADVGDKQVRHTHHPHGRLLIYPEDQDDQRFVFVVGATPTFTVVGWTRAIEAKQPHYWTTHIGGRPLQCPCFAVPQEMLRPIPAEIVAAWEERETAREPIEWAARV